MRGVMIYYIESIVHMNQSGYQDLLNNSIINADSLIVDNLTLPNLDPNSVPYIDVNHNVSDIVLNNGQLIVGKTANAPVAASLTGTTDEIIVTNGPGTITLSTPQPIATTSSPTFTNITINGNVAGPVNTRTADNIISNTGIGAAGNIPKFVSNKVIQDSNIAASNLFLADGTVNATGNFNLNSRELQNVSALRPYNTNIIVGTGASAIDGSNIVIGNSSSISNSGTCIVIGNSDTLQNNCTNGVLIGDSVTLTAFGGMTDSVYLGSNIISQGGSRNVIVGKGSTNDTGNDNVIIGQASSITAAGVSNTVIGASSTMTGSGGVTVGQGNTVGGSSVTIGVGNTCTAVRGHSLGLNVSNAIANSFLIDARTNVRCDVDNLTDLGTSTKYWKDGYFKGSLIGGTNSRTVDNIVSNSGTNVSGDIPSFSGITGKIIQDSGILAANLVTNSGTNISGDIPSFSGITGKIITDSGILATNIVQGPAIVTADNLCSFDATSGKLIKDANISSFNVITDSGTAILNRVATYTASKTIHDSGILSTNLFLVDGSVSMTGVLNQSNFTDSTLVSNGSIVSLGGIGISKSLIAGGLIKTTLTTDSINSTTGALIVSGGIGCAKALNIGGKITVSTTGGTNGLDLAAGDVYANLRVIQNSTGADKDMYIGFNSGATSSLHLYSNNNQTVYINRGNVVLGGAVTTTSTDGYVYIPTVPGVATGAATAYAGCVPMVYDTTNNRLAIRYNGVWRSTLLS